MKNLFTNTPIKLNFAVLLVIFGIAFSGLNTVSAQDAILGSGLKFGENQLTPEEEKLVQDYLNPSENLTDAGIIYPPIWDKPIPQSNPCPIILPLVSNPRVNDIPLEQYDYVGGFYTDDNGDLKCGGAGYWPDTSGILFTLHRDNPNTPEKDGFANSEIIYFKLFSFSTMKDYDVDVIEWDPEYSATNKFAGLVLKRILDIQALEQIDFFIQPSNNPMCLGDEITLSAEEFIGTGGNYSYQWSSVPEGFDYNVQYPPPVSPEVNTVFNLVVSDGPLVSEHSLPVVVQEKPGSNAGNDTLVCANESVVLGGSATNFTSVEWTTSGNGFFDDSLVLNPTYTPGSQDINNGQVILSMEAMPLSACTLTDTDELVLEVLPLPAVETGEDMTVCTTENVMVSATAIDYSAVQWSTSGDGEFTNPNSLTSEYIADNNDFQNGVFLIICAQAQSPCVASDCDTVHVDFVPGPMAIGMLSNTGCENNGILVSGIAYNASSTLWTTAGDGTFADPSLFGTQYYPGPQDAGNGSVIVTLNAYPIGNCEMDSHDVTVTVVSLPNITFQQNPGFICEGDEFLELNPTINNSNSVLWSTNGDGTFNDNHLTNPIYFPGPLDEQIGEFTLEIQAYPLQYCTLSTYEEFSVSYVDNPTANAGIDATICEDDFYHLQDASAENFSQVSWSGGNGIFSDPFALNPYYTPATSDYGTIVTLCLTANPYSPCDVAANDCMNLLVMQNPTSDAGDDAAICEGDSYTVSGTVLYTDDFIWTTSGDGTFANANNAITEYTPGTQDIFNETVSLTLTAQPNAPCAVVATDDMQLDIQPALIAGAGDDAVICDTDDHTLTTAFADNYENLIWSSNGDGDFDDITEVKPTYTPGDNDIESGIVELSLSATAISPCTVGITDSKILNIIRTVETDSGDDAAICEGDSYTVSGTVLYTDDFIWTTSGDGTFANANNAITEYTPGTQDIFNETVSLTLTAQPNAPCAVVATDDMQLDIQPALIAGAGDDAVICDTDDHTLTTAFADNYENLIWSSNGDGDFDDITEVKPTYTPGDNDIESGIVELSLSATAISPCTVGITDSKILNIIRTVETDSGDDAAICEDDSYTVSGTVLYTDDFIWTTSGDGTFANANDVITEYTPGTQDIFNETVSLTLTAQPNAPCAVVATDDMQLDIQPALIAGAGDDAVICDTDDHTLTTAFADNYENLIWSSNGDGDFDDITEVKPTYTPGDNDIESGIVELSLSATAISPCTVGITDSKILNIIRTVETDAGDDAAICEGDSYTVSGTVLYTDDFIWTTSGDGTFANANDVITEYTPGTQDIFNETVSLTLTAQPNAPCAVVATDDMQLDIQPALTAGAGDDTVICDTDDHTLTTAFADNYENLIWSSNGDGDFDDITEVKPTYTPGDNDIESGIVELSLSATAISPCTVGITDSKILNIIRTVETDAGDDAAICEGDSYTVSGTVLYTDDFIWTTSGDGTFANANDAITEYTPGMQDIANETVSLTLTAQPNAPCSAIASDFIILQVSQNSVLSMGDDVEVCGTESISLSDVSASNFSSLLWTTNGDGTFSDPNIQNPDYYPGEQDLNNDQVILTLTASPEAPCVLEVSETLSLSVALPPLAQAGDDLTSCNDEVILAGSVENAAGVLWSSSGDGSFDDETSLNALYYPGINDLSLGMVNLTLTASAIAPCSVAATDQLEIVFDELDLTFDFVEDKVIPVGNLLYLGFGVNSSSAGEYKWYFNGDEIPGQIGPNLFILNLQAENAGYYQGSFTNNCGTIETNTGFVQVTEGFTHEINLPAGWSGISSFVTPAVPELEFLLQGISNELIIMSNNDGIYWPGENMNTLGAFSITSGYEIKLSDNAVMYIEGNIRYPFSGLSIEPGWSYLPVNTNCAVDVESQFGNIAGITLIKEIAGSGIYWPELGINTLFELLPGKAYLVLNTSTEAVDVKYAGCDSPYTGMEQKAAISPVETPWNQITATASTHVFGFTGDALSGFENGDIIGAFNSSGNCAGLQIIKQSSPSSLVVFGDDVLSEFSDGLNIGEEVSFKLYRPSTDEEFELNVSYDGALNQQGTFSENGISLISKAQLKNATAVEDDVLEMKVQVYPNPTTGQLKVVLDNKPIGNGSITLNNANGQVIISRDFAGTPNLSFNIGNQPKGIYYLKVVAGGKVHIEKVILK